MQVKQLVVVVLTPLISGATTFGAIALHQHGLNSLVGSGRVHAAAQSSPEPEVLLSNWPQQCEILRQALLNQPQLTTVTYEARPIEPFVTPAWKLNWQGETIALPLVKYSDVRVARNEDGRLFVVLEDPQLDARVILNQLRPSQPLKDVFATVPHPSLSLAQLQAEPVAAVVSSSKGESVKAAAERQTLAAKRSRSGAKVTEVAAPVTPLSWDGPSLTERLFDGPVALEQLIDEGYRHQPKALSCKAEAWEHELPIAMGLALKLSTGTDAAPESVYAKVGQQPGRVLRRLTDQKTIWQANFGTGEFYSEVMISLPSNHESAAVGMGMGQENWWDAEPRPEWLIALERAVEVDSEYAWQALSVELHRAGMSNGIAQSIQKLTLE